MSDGLKSRQSTIKLFMGVAGLAAMTASHYKPEIEHAKIVIKEAVIQVVTGKKSEPLPQALIIK